MFSRQEMDEVGGMSFLGGKLREKTGHLQALAVYS
jgi:hypothetical protein